MPTAHASEVVKVLNRKVEIPSAPDSFDAVFSAPAQADRAKEFGDPITVQGLAAKSPKSLFTVVRAIGKHAKPKERMLLVTSIIGLNLLDAWLKDGSPEDMRRGMMAVTGKVFAPGKLYRITDKGLQVATGHESGEYCMTPKA
jgi:hypothetical protein